MRTDSRELESAETGAEQRGLTYELGDGLLQALNDLNEEQRQMLARLLTEQPSLYEVLDACIDDVLAGRPSVEDRLEAWPQYREQLSPLLEGVEALSLTLDRQESDAKPDSRCLWAELRERLVQMPQRSLAASSAPRRRAIGVAAVSAGVAGVTAVVLRRLGRAHR